MVISLMGPSGIRCQVADFSLLIDPPAKRKGSLTLLTESKPDKDALLVDADTISGPGEYEVSGVRVKGVQVSGAASGQIKTAYTVRFDDLNLGVLNGLGAIPADELIDKLGTIDILFLDIERSTLAGKEIASLIKKVEPAIVVPVTSKGAKKLLEDFGQKASQEEKLTLKAKDINPEEGMKIVWLKE